MNARKITPKALSLSVAAVALNLGAAHASTVPIFGGGSTEAYELYDTAGQCVGVQNSTETASAIYDDVDNARSLGCTTPLSTGYEYLFDGADSGQALQAFTSNDPTRITRSNYNVFDTVGVPSVTSLPYPSLQLAFSDAPLDTPDTLDNPFSSSITPADFTQIYTSNVSDRRGAAWEIPTTAMAVALGYDLPTTSFVSSGTSYSGVQFGNGFYGTTQATATVYNGSATAPINPTVVTQLDLSVNMVCYIWTGYDSLGELVVGTSSNGATATTPPISAGSWSDAVFYGAYSTSATPKPIKFDSNLVQSSVSGLPIKPYHRTDASGSTYLFTLWLQHNCKGYAAAGYSVPAVTVTWPSWMPDSIYGVSGTAAMGTTLASTPGAIGYISTQMIVPAVSPTSGKGPIAAFLLVPKTRVYKSTMADFLYPNTVNTMTSETGAALPATLTLSKWGTMLNKRFFKSAARNSGYAITGLSYVLGYSCYSNASNNDTYDGVKAFLNFMTTSNYQTLADTLGFAPLKQSQYASIVGMVETAPRRAALAGLTPGSSSPKICFAFNSSSNQ
jgi:ABC-type phosphate transport system substrate-binding protein